MLVVPYLAGLVMARDARPLDVGDATLGLTWLVGYFAYNAATLTLRAPARRRGRYLPALVVYGAAATVLGLATLAVKGWGLLAWAPVYLVLVGWALWLAASKRERSLLSGVLTVVASCGLMAVLQPWALDDPTRWRDVPMMLLITAYFVGTVLHVKALIRERNDPQSTQRSQAYHAAVSLGGGPGGEVLLDAAGPASPGSDRGGRDPAVGLGSDPDPPRLTACWAGAGARVEPMDGFVGRPRGC